MKVSEITINDVAEYLRCDATELILDPILSAAIRYVSDYTGIAIEDSYFVTADAAYNSGKTYYTLSSGIYTKFTGTAFTEGTTYYEKKESLDDHEDFFIVIMVLCQDMYDNRSLYVDKSNVNKVVDSILYMHCKNLI